MTAGEIRRRAARALLLTASEEFLLLRYEHPELKKPFWITPGGGLEAGETSEQGLRREILEETGLAEFAIGPRLWLREFVFRWRGRSYRQSEEFFLVRVERCDASHHAAPDPEERDAYLGHRWWRCAELGDSGERVAPRHLPELVAALLAEGPPADPVSIGR